MKTPSPVIFVLLVAVCLAFCGCDSRKSAASGTVDSSSKPAEPYFARFAKVTGDVVSKQPDWDPSRPLPKSVDELSQIVVAAYTPSASQPKTGWKLESITFFHVPRDMWPSLRNVDREQYKNKWYCRVYISAFGDHKGEWWKNQAEANVFLDGTFLSPPTAIE